MPLRYFRRQCEQLMQFERGRIIGGVGTSGSEKYHLHEDQAKDALDRPIVEKSGTSGTAHEETKLQRNGTRSSLATNPDSISAVKTIVFVCGDFVVNASNLHLLYSDTSLPQLGCHSYNTRSPLVLIRGTMEVQRYVHDILQPHVSPLMKRLPGAIFQ
ncbi:uncharacterized protein TNCV_78431 [Trichonephila clavipes]|nr:uncharacterized protein TNCV_78431 [Trichonephila clavipes]